MQAFNSMTRELDKSREIVAQTERELAWKKWRGKWRMRSRIRSTPMKLSVQHQELSRERKTRTSTPSSAALSAP